MHLNRGLNVCFTLAALTVLVLGACGKSEPEAGTKTSALKASAQPQVTKKDDPAKPALGAIATPTPAASAVPVAARMDMPDDVVGVVALKSLDSVLNAAKTTLELLDPESAQPGFVSATKEGIKESLGWKDIGWVAPDKPIRTVLFNAKQYDGKAQFIALPMTDKDAVLAALPDGAKQKEGDHVAMYDNNGQTVFVDFVEGHAIYTDHPEFYAKGKVLFEKSLRSWIPSRAMEVKLDLDNIYSLYLPELAQAKRQLIASYTTPGTGPSGFNRLVAFEIETLFSVFESSHQSDLNIWLDGKTIHVASSFLPKAETSLDVFTKANANKRPTLAKKVPASGYINSAIHIDTRTLDALMSVIDQATIDAYKEMADLRPEDVAAIDAQLKLMTKQSMGDAVISGYVDNEFPAALVAQARLTDPLAVQAAYGKIFNILVPRAIAKLKATGLAEVPPELANAKTIKDILPTLNELGGPLGLKLALVDEKADGIVTAGFKVNIDWPRFIAATGLSTEDRVLVEVIKVALGNQFSGVFAVKDKVGALAFGPTAIKTAKSVLLEEAPLGGGEPGLNRAVTDHIAAVSVRLETVMKAATAFIPALAAKRELIAKIPAERPLIASMESTGKSLTMEIAVPVDVMHAVGLVQK